ncbi:hypothetical protein JCM11641_006708 [Rhodosporidiobolus odoratus]
MDNQLGLPNQPSFLRSTAQRAGSLALWAPRQAVARSVPRYMQSYLPSTLLPPHPASSIPSPSSAAPTSSSSSPLALPSPITFLTSAYLFLALFLAFFLHRIHHLVPPRLSSRHSPTSAVKRVLTPAVQLGCRAPGTLLMLRAALGLVIAIAAGDSTQLNWWSQGQGWTGTAAKGAAKLLVWSTAWAGKGTLGSFLASSVDPENPWTVNHSSLLWSSFISIAVCLACETFVRALSDDAQHTNHFNLLSYAFLLHVHSAPSPSTSSGAVAANNRELYIYILLTLLELSTLQLSYAFPFLVRSPTPTQLRRRRKSPYRLAISAFYSLLSQYFAVRSWIRIFDGTGSQAKEGRELEVFSTIWLNKVPELCFEIVVVTSLGLKGLAALIRNEEMSFENIVGHATPPSRDEDYAVALIKFTTHLLTSTRLSGLAFELSPLEVLPAAVSSSLTGLGLLDAPPTAAELARAEHEARTMGTGVVLRSSGEVWFDEPVPPSAAQDGLRTRRSTAGTGADSSGEPSRPERVPDGFGHEIRRITVEDRENPLPLEEGAMIYPGQRDMMPLEGERKTALWRFVAVAARIVLYCSWWLVSRSRWMLRAGLAKLGWRRAEWEMEMSLRASRSGLGRERRERSRSLLPVPTKAPEDGLLEEEEEEEDGDFVPGREPEAGYSSSEESEESEEEREWDWETDGEDAAAARAAADEDVTDPLTLFTDLSQPPSSSRPSARRSASNDLVISNQEGVAMTPHELAPYLLAHHLTPSSSAPLTRTRYRSLLPPAPPSQRQSPLYSNEATSSAIDAHRSALISRATTEGLQHTEGGLEGWMERRREEWREGRSRFCVVCTVEERSVVLWPCRCLCLCDPCRSALADRTTTTSATASAFEDGASASAGGAICPTCRTPVAGFSRIYIP